MTWRARRTARLEMGPGRGSGSGNCYRSSGAYTEFIFELFNKLSKLKNGHSLDKIFYFSLVCHCLLLK